PDCLGLGRERRVDILATFFVMSVHLKVHDVGYAPYPLGQPAEVRLAGVHAIRGLVREPRHRWKSGSRLVASASASPTATCGGGSLRRSSRSSGGCGSCIALDQPLGRTRTTRGLGLNSHGPLGG